MRASTLTVAYVVVLNAFMVGGSLAGCIDSSSSSLPPDASIDVQLPDGHASDVDLGDATDAAIDSASDASDATTTDSASQDAGADARADASVDAAADALADAVADAAHEAGITTGPIVSAGSTTWPVGLAYVGTTLFFLTQSDPRQNAGAFQTCTPTQNDCGSPATLQGMTSLPGDAQITTDGTKMWFTQGAVGHANVVIYNCPVSGCSVTTLASSYSSTGGFWDEVSGLAVDGTSLYFAGGTPGMTNYRIFRADKNGVSPMVNVVSNLARTANLAVDASHFYWGLAGGGIYSCPTATDAGACTPTLVQATGSTSGLFVDATSIYWAEPAAGAIYRCPLGGCGGSMPTTIASGLGHVNCLTEAGSWLLYSVGDSVDGGASNGIFAAPK